MTEMSERVAKALFLTNNPRLSWEEQSTKSPVSVDIYRLLAKIAIEAMREPNDEMLNLVTPWNRKKTKAFWQAMIDEALKDEQ